MLRSSSCLRAMLPTFLPVLPLKRDHAGGKTCPVPTSIQGPEADKYSKGGVHTRKALLPVNTRADGPLFKPLVWLPCVLMMCCFTGGRCCCLRLRCHPAVSCACSASEAVLLAVAMLAAWSGHVGLMLTSGGEACRLCWVLLLCYTALHLICFSLLSCN